MEWLLPYVCMVTVPHIMVGLERLSDYRGVGLGRFHCTWNVKKDSKSFASSLLGSGIRLCSLNYFK